MHIGALLNRQAFCKSCLVDALPEAFVKIEFRKFHRSFFSCTRYTHGAMRGIEKGKSADQFRAGLSTGAAVDKKPPPAHRMIEVAALYIFPRFTGSDIFRPIHHEWEPVSDYS